MSPHLQHVVCNCLGVGFFNTLLEFGRRGEGHTYAGFDFFSRRRHHRAAVASVERPESLKCNAYARIHGRFGKKFYATRSGGSVQTHMLSRRWRLKSTSRPVDDLHELVSNTQTIQQSNLVHTQGSYARRAGWSRHGGVCSTRVETGGRSPTGLATVGSFAYEGELSRKRGPACRGLEARSTWCRHGQPRIQKRNGRLSQGAGSSA